MITYRLIILLLSPVILAHLLWKSFQSKQLRYLKQRLGFGFTYEVKASTGHLIWFHCASVGEVNTTLPLLHELHKHDPNLSFIITTNTVTGASIIDKQRKSFIKHAYLPIDWTSSTQRFINTINPTALFIIETELWPNLVNVCKRAQINITILNGRLSPRTTETNKWVASIYRRTLKNINHIYTRSDVDKDHFLKLGASEDQTTMTGNLKYALSSKIITPQDLTKRCYVIAASTHDDEEQQIADCWLKLNRDELLVIAPRHPERKNKIFEQLSLLTDKIVIRTDNTEITDDTKIFLLDTVGELLTWYVSADAVIMGGSFADRGGHNVIEPAQQGKAILYGPHMENFQFENQLLLDNDAAIQLTSMKELATSLSALLDDKANRAQLENNALGAVKPYETILSDYTDIVFQQL